MYKASYIIKFQDQTQILLSSELESPMVLVREPKIHSVREGDTLFSISVQYFNTAHLWYTISELNNLEDPFALELGASLDIPSFGN